MRLIGAIVTETQAHRFCAYLARQGIESRCEGLLDAETGQFIYQVWVADEDRLPEAKESLSRFEADPMESRFDHPVVQMQPEEEVSLSRATAFKRRLAFPITTFFLTLCCSIFLINLMQEIESRKEGSSLLFTPIQRLFLYDFPPVIEEGSSIETVERASYWHGLYDWILLKAKDQDTRVAEGPLFMKIRQGEGWRLFSPCVLHLNLLHILFNMIWLWVLGRPIEQRIGSGRTLLMALVIGILSNTAQYVMSGPFFLGYSGIVMGQAGFIWMREKIAPWEGYPLQRSTILFLIIFILAMLGLQLLSFFVQVFSELPFILNIANTAHLIGGLVGAWLGRFRYFAWRVK